MLTEFQIKFLEDEYKAFIKENKEFYILNIQFNPFPASKVLDLKETIEILDLLYETNSIVTMGFTTTHIEIYRG